MAIKIITRRPPASITVAIVFSLTDCLIPLKFIKDATTINPRAPARTGTGKKPAAKS